MTGNTTVDVLQYKYFVNRHEDIRDAILSLVNMFRDTGDKLERHEYRERQLGEQLKKALVGLDKRHRTADHNLDTIIKVVNNLDERLVNMEKTLAQVSNIYLKIFSKNTSIPSLYLINDNHSPPQWSRGTVLSSRSKVHGFKPG